MDWPKMDWLKVVSRAADSFFDRLRDQENEMNFFKLAGLSALFLIAGCPALLAQSVITPGALPDSSNDTPNPLSLGIAVGTANILPKTDIASVEDTHAKHVRMIWIASILSMTAATTADAATSWHKRESNGFLASSNGTFGGKGLALKSGIAGAMLAPQLIFRKHHDWYTAFAVGNFVETGIFTGAAIHNVNTK
jgi:hypothetical protein